MNYYDLITPKTEPYRHQIDAVNKALPALLDEGFFALLMDIGTGKSKTALDVVRILAAMDRIDAVVIIPPKSLMGSWQDQISAHFGEASVLRWDSAKARAQAWQASVEEFRHKKTPFFFVNVEAFQSKNAALDNSLMRYCQGRRILAVVDESTTIKTHNSARTRNISKIAQSYFDCRIIMTGREVTNSVEDLYSQFEFLRKGFWGQTFYFFQHTYEVIKEGWAHGRTYPIKCGVQNVDKLQKRIAPYSYRVNRQDCLDLPEKQYVTIEVEMTAPVRIVYEGLKNELVHQLESGAVITALNKMVLFTKFRQITGGTTVEGLVDSNPGKLQALIDDLSDHDEQAIVWSSYANEIRLIYQRLKDSGIPCVTFYGEDAQAARDLYRKEFEGKGARVFLANPSCGGRGLNLQANCALQYWYSMPSSVDLYEQAEGRTWRSGQTRKCVYKSLITRGTADERVYELLSKKVEISEMFRDGTAEDVLSLL